MIQPEAGALRLGAELYRTGRFFEAHEAWEVAWLPLRGTAEGELLRALIQLAAACVQLEAGRTSGFRSLAAAAAERIESNAPTGTPAAHARAWLELARALRQYRAETTPDLAQRPGLLGLLSVAAGDPEAT